MKLSYEVIVKDRHGKVIQHLKSKSKSWLKQWNQMIYGGMAGSAQMVTDITGTDRSQSITYDLLWIGETAGDDTIGVVVGSVATAVTMDDYKLDTQIAHGVGAGQLDHLANDVIHPPSINGPTCYFLLTRVFINSSGGLVVVREIGIYARISSAGNACIARDALTGVVNVPNGGSVTVIYSVKAVA
ncbi:MAG: hypothetical protein ACE5IA_04625 [Dehalococcoidia bacterium]